MKRILFVSGTDTGVGKTLVAALLVHHLRRTGIRAAALKPFCSGGGTDLTRLRAAQDNQLSQREICPFFYAQPLAPWVAARREKRLVQLAEAVRHIRAVSQPYETLIVEGAGGLLVPLGPGYSALDLIVTLRAETIVVAANRLGVINHVLLTLQALRQRGCRRMRVVLNDVGKHDPSVASNAAVLRELNDGIPVVSMPWLGCKALIAGNLKKNCKKVKKVLARLAQ